MNYFRKKSHEKDIPFIKGFESGDDELFKSVHSKDIARVLQDSKADTKEGASEDAFRKASPRQE